MGQEGERRPEAVVGGLIDEAPEGGEEAPHLPARLMENAGRAPALGAAHDAIMAELAAHPLKLGGDQIERAVPGDRHEGFAPAALATAATAGVETFPHHRLSDAVRRVYPCWNGLD